MIGEIPAGRSVQLTVWRNGRSESITTKLGKMQARTGDPDFQGSSAVFNFRMPEMPEVAPMPEIPSIEWEGGGLLMGLPAPGN